jgi:hypothetical protein
VDYVTWQGPNSENRAGSIRSLARGPDISLRQGKTYLACGANKSLSLGPTKGLAKGSIYAGLKSASLETRGN